MQLHKLACSYMSLHAHAVPSACMQFLFSSEQLTRISQCLLHIYFSKFESAPRVVDNIIGALARSVIGDPSTLVDDTVVAILNNVPLKEDKDEYNIIFKFFTTLLASQHPSFHRCLPKIVECSAVFYTDLTIDKVKILS